MLKKWWFWSVVTFIIGEIIAIKWYLVLRENPFWMEDPYRNYWYAIYFFFAVPSAIPLIIFGIHGFRNDMRLPIDKKEKIRRQLLLIPFIIGLILSALNLETPWDHTIFGFMWAYTIVLVILFNEETKC